MKETSASKCREESKGIFLGCLVRGNVHEADELNYFK